MKQKQDREQYGVIEVHPTGRAISASEIDGNNRYSLDQARAIAEVVSTKPGIICAQVIDWTKKISRRVREVYRNGQPEAVVYNLFN